MATLLTDHDTIFQITPSGYGAWVDVDLSASIPSGAEGVILRARNRGSDSGFGVRKKGSTDSFTSDLVSNVIGTFSCGVDSNRIFQVYAHLYQDIYVLAYLKDGEAYFNTNLPQRSYSAGGWEDQSIDYGSLGISIPKGVMCFCPSSLNSWKIRPNGSSQTWTESFWSWGDSGTSVTGCDASGVYEANFNTGDSLYEVGYFLKNCHFHINPIQNTVPKASWENLPQLGNGAILAFYQNDKSISYTDIDNRPYNGANEFTGGRWGWHGQILALWLYARVTQVLIDEIADGELYEVGYLTDGSENGIMLGADF